MKYCTRCLMPSTKPYITFNEDGVCAACQTYETKTKAVEGIDWSARSAEFEELVSWVRSQNAPVYDVLVPVSGGKDSITQVSRFDGMGLRILAVNIDYGIKTEVGIRNLNLIPDKMDTNLMIYRPEQNLHKRIIRIGLEEYGDPDLLSHAMLHAYPIRVGLQFNIPLVFLGENSAFEYGGESKIANSNTMTRDWFMKYAANNGHDATYIAKKYDIPYERLVHYDFPDNVKESDTKPMFSSYYFYWDSEEHLKIAQKYGFESLSKSREGSYRNYVGIDEKINRLHQYLKVLKFGYGRATDHACEDIRSGRLSRDEAKVLVKEYDLQPLSDEYIDDIVDYLGYKREEFIDLLEQFRNHDIWKKDSNGNWFIPGHLEE